MLRLLGLAPCGLYLIALAWQFLLAANNASGLGYELIPVAFLGFPVSFLGFLSPSLEMPGLILGPCLNAAALYFFGTRLMELAATDHPALGRPLGIRRAGPHGL